MWNKNCWYSQRAAPRFWSILMSMQTNDFHSSVCHSTHLSLFHWWHHSVNNRAFVHLHTHITPSGRWYNTHTHILLWVCVRTHSWESDSCSFCSIRPDSEQTEMLESSSCKPPTLWDSHSGSGHYQTVAWTKDKDRRGKKPVIWLLRYDIRDKTTTECSLRSQLVHIYSNNHF